MNSGDTNRGIKRVAYRLAMIIGGSKYCSLVIATPDATGYYLEDSYPLGLPIDMAYFIYQHCRCAFCGASISRDLGRCKCGEPNDSDDPDMHLEVKCTNDMYYSVFKPILERENSRIKSFKRKQRTEANGGGSYTKKDITFLYQLQEGRCYFCGEPFLENARGASYHADHYLSIFDGGKNDLSNIVLACPSCNLRKGAMDGDSFEYIAKKIRSPDNGRKLGQIRRKVNAFRAGYNVAGKNGDLDT